jgi:DNA-binding Lrp family transcriptional regulator
VTQIDFLFEPLWIAKGLDLAPVWEALQISEFWFSKMLKSHLVAKVFRLKMGINQRFEASVNFFVDPTQKEQVIDALSKLENIEEIYDVKGEFDIVSLVSASSVEEFHKVLQEKINKIKGVKCTIISVVLKAHKHPKASLNNIHLR